MRLKIEAHLELSTFFQYLLQIKLPYFVIRPCLNSFSCLSLLISLESLPSKHFGQLFCAALLESTQNHHLVVGQSFHLSLKLK